MGDWTRVPIEAPRIEDRDALKLAGINERYQTEGFDFAAFPAQMQRMKDGLSDVSERVGGAIYDLFWDMFDSGDAFGYLAAVEVAPESTLPADFERVRLPAQRYAIFGHSGEGDPRDTIYTIWFDWLPASDFASPAGLQFLYVPGDPERPGNVTQIWLPITER